MQSSRRCFLAAGCWLMACLVAPGALRVAAAAVAAAAAAPVNSLLAERPLGVGGLAANTHSNNNSSNSSGSVPRATTNAAASAAAAAAALAAVATGSLSLRPDESLSSAAIRVNMMTRKRESLLKALGVAAAPAAAAASAAAAAAAGGNVGGNSNRFAAAESTWTRKLATAHLQQQQHHHQCLQQPQLVQQQHEQQLQQQSTEQRDADQQRLSGASGLLPRRLTGSLFGCMYRRGPFGAAAAAAATKHRKHALPLGSLWTRRLQKQNLQMKRIDAGGGGDCLFLSVALALQGERRAITSQGLRDLAAMKVAGLDSTGPHAKETGDWGELWSPSAVLNSKQLYVNRDGVCFDVRTPLGKAKAVFHEMRQPGNNHWGTGN
ncbi:hypothetical protein, conserved [Eimeria maxima]|uniref:Calpain catalytic domain-containing protein n=1 Tax=Eimeria maxima TaxID=5804 RepID=U6MGN8_EIMMA|nr:hypothetical protein, conserved [Eimeria maxima]CDJ61609.1 hypothetical protein, conserved [Eimeria maxima]